MAHHPGIYSATYSSVPVYEFKVGAHHVMRRRSDDYINATHILKVAEFDKPARTRILEREVQKGVHEKVQGGYGKYQGTWIPLKDGRDLAMKNNVLDKLAPIFDFVPTDHSPPPAPKHTTAVSNKPKVPRLPPHGRKSQPNAHRRIDDSFDNISSQLNDDETPERSTLDSESFMAEEDMVPMSQNSAISRKRKRGKDKPAALSSVEQAHLLYADELLDYFMLSSSDDPGVMHVLPPEPPEPFLMDRPIDDVGHTALHWAASMGDIEVVKDLMKRGADPNVLSSQELTPLMRAVMFTNNYEKDSMHKLVNLLQSTILVKDFFGATVFHHLAQTCGSRSKWKCAQYYAEVIITKLNEIISSQQVAEFLNARDNNGDTAVLMAARHGAIKVAKTFLAHYAAGDIPNSKGEIADEILLNLSKPNGGGRISFPSSSPFHGNSGHETRNGHTEPSMTSANMPFSNSYSSQAASNLASKIAPMVLSKSDELAKAFDWELQDKEATLVEGQNLHASLESERQSVQQQMHVLMRNMEDEDAINERRDEYNGLVRDNESLLEQIQHGELHQAVRSEEQKVDPALFREAKQHQSPEELEEKWKLGLELMELQQQRRELVKRSVRHQSRVGTGEKTAKYRRLVALSTGQQEDEIDDMSAELLDAVKGDKIDEIIPSTPPRAILV